MPLKLTLKPHEKVILGGAVIQNGTATAHLVVENNVPVLRQADIMTEAEANSPCRRIYFTVQLMYIDEKNSAELHPLYWQLVRELVEAVPSTNSLLSQISQYILSGKLYQALKQAKKLITYEQELLKNVSESS